jgi:hypothetical protein
LPDSSELLMASIVASSSKYSTSVLNSSVCNVGYRQNQGPFYSTEILYAWCKVLSLFLLTSAARELGSRFSMVRSHSYCEDLLFCFVMGWHTNGKYFIFETLYPLPQT